MGKYDEYLDAQKILDDSDYYPIINEETKERTLGLGNGGCLKLSAELDLTHRIIQEECVEHGEYIRYEFTVEIVDASGRVLAQDVGTCDSAERPDMSRHNMRAFAKTRAWQRGIKSAAKVQDRVAADLTPNERIAPPEMKSALEMYREERAARQAESREAQPQAAQPQAAQPQAAQPQAAQNECVCDLQSVTTPRKVGDGYVCGTCGHALAKPKRIQFVAAQMS